VGGLPGIGVWVGRMMDRERERERERESRYAERFMLISFFICPALM
jgi:hypothetical protein